MQAQKCFSMGEMWYNQQAILCEICFADTSVSRAVTKLHKLKDNISPAYLPLSRSVITVYNYYFWF